MLRRSQTRRKTQELSFTSSSAALVLLCLASCNQQAQANNLQSPPVPTTWKQISVHPQHSSIPAALAAGRTYIQAITNQTTAVLPAGQSSLQHFSTFVQPNLSNATVHQVIATINTRGFVKSQSPATLGVVANPAGTLLYVVNQDTFPGTVAILDTATNAIIGRITVGKGPVGIAINPSGTRLYVANSYDNSISVISTATNKVIAVISLGPAQTVTGRQGAWELSVNAHGTLLAATSMDSTNVALVDLRSNAVINSIAVGTTTKAVAFSPNGSQLLVTAAVIPGAVYVINPSTQKLVTTIPVGPEPMGIAFTPSGKAVYVSNWGNGTISIINPTTDKVTGLVRLGNDAGPESIAARPDGSAMYVVEEMASGVAVISTSNNTVSTTIQTGGNPHYLAFANNNLFYVTSEEFGVKAIQIIDPVSQVAQNSESPHSIQQPIIPTISTDTSSIWLGVVNSIGQTIANSLNGNDRGHGVVATLTKTNAPPSGDNADDHSHGHSPQTGNGGDNEFVLDTADDS